MKKLKLELDRIRVESFKVEAEKGRTGTVNAFSSYCGTTDTCHFCLEGPAPVTEPQLPSTAG